MKDPKPTPLHQFAADFTLPGSWVKGAELQACPQASFSTTLEPAGKRPRLYPTGLVVHYTAGAGALSGVIATAKSNKYGFDVIDREGTLHQTLLLRDWGWHAGPSQWLGIGKGVSKDFVGVEMIAAGILVPMDNRSPQNGGRSYFGTEYWTDDVRWVHTDYDNIQRGLYHRYTPAQEQRLLQYCLWLKYNNPDVFDFNNVAGHDEVCTPKRRKQDPGGALSMSMPTFRKLLKLTYARLTSNLTA